MSDPDPSLKQAVTKLKENAQSLEGLFAQNWQNEANRQRLQSAYETQGILIKTNLATLISKTPKLKPALNAPNSAYNQFISTWNNGTGDLERSFKRINEFWTLLQAAEPELNRLMVVGPSGIPP